MAQISRFWGGTVTGDCGPYSADEFAKVFFSMMQDGNPGVNFVAPKYLNELAVSGAGSPFTMATGAALVAGIWYENTSAITNITLANTSSNTRIDTVILRANWTTQTVRQAVLTGTQSASPVAVTLTQTVGTTYEVAVAHLTMGTAGLVLLANARGYAQMAGMGKPIIASIILG